MLAFGSSGAVMSFSGYPVFKYGIVRLLYFSRDRIAQDVPREGSNRENANPTESTKQISSS